MNTPATEYDVVCLKYGYSYEYTARHKNLRGQTPTYWPERISSGTHFSRGFEELILATDRTYGEAMALAERCKAIWGQFGIRYDALPQA